MKKTKKTQKKKVRGKINMIKEIVQCSYCGAETEVEENVQGRPLCEECKKLFDESEVQSK